MRQIPESFFGPVSESEAESLMDRLSGDDKFWAAIKEALTEGRTCRELGYEIFNRCEALEEEAKNAEPEGLDGECA